MRNPGELDPSPELSRKKDGKEEKNEGGKEIKKEGLNSLKC